MPATLEAPPSDAVLPRPPVEHVPMLEAIRLATHMRKREREAIAAYLNVQPDNPALPAFMAICYQHGLSPFAGLIHLYEQRVMVRNAAGREEEVVRHRPAAGRDGFLAIAQQSGLMRGLHGDVVCANDHFDVAWHGVPTMQAPAVEHRYAPLLPGQDARDARAYRGAIIGAWAKGYRADQYPMFYFAPLREHGRVHEDVHTGEKSWAGAWSYTSAMNLKSAESRVLRILWGISGVLPLDELRTDPSVAAEFGLTDTSAQHADLDDVAWPEGEVGGRLRAAVERANELEPHRFTPAVAEMVFGSQPPAAIEKMTADLEAENIRREMEREPATKDEPAGQVVDDPVAELRASIEDADRRAGRAKTRKTTRKWLAIRDERVEELRKLTQSGTADE